MKHLFKLCLLGIASFFTTSVFSGPPPIGTMMYQLNHATPVPSLSGTMLIVLSLLLFVVAFRIAKQKNANAGKFFIMLLGVGAISSGMSGKS